MWGIKEKGSKNQENGWKSVADRAEEVVVSLGHARVLGWNKFPGVYRGVFS